ncbi:MAG: SBBP repeat-containing protein [Bacteroidota bacterium]
MSVLKHVPMTLVAVIICLALTLDIGGAQTHTRERRVEKNRPPVVKPFTTSKRERIERFEDKWKRSPLPGPVENMSRREKLSTRQSLRKTKPWKNLMSERPRVDREAARKAGISEAGVDSALSAWVTHYSSGLAPSLDAAYAITFDASGNVYVAGYTTGIFSSYDAVVLKYNSSGVLQWLASYNGTGNDYDAVTAIVVDGSGNVYVAGSSFGIDTDEDFVTIKYNSSGVQQWVARYNGPADDYDAAVGIKVDNGGNSHVTGVSYGATTDADIVTVRYNSAGVQLWAKSFDGGISDFDIPVGLGIDISGSVYVSGTSYGEETYEDFVTIKYSFLGTQVWVRRYDGPGNDYDAVSAMTVDVGGNTYVTGASYNLEFDADYATIKYDTFGGTDWTSRYNSPEESDDLPTAITIDASRNVYITGTTYAFATGDDYLTIKYSSTGGVRWVAAYNGPGNSYDAASAIFVDASDNVYVTGSSTGSGTFEDFATVKYTSIGLQMWAARYVGEVNDYDAAAAVVVDGFGNVHVTGTSYGLVTDEDIATVKYSSVGVQLWQTRYNGPGNSADEASAVAVDAFGNIYITGASFDQQSQSDYATVKYNAAGVQQWVVRYDGPGEAEDFPSAIAVDQFGNSYVTGTSFGLATGYDIATTKYNVNGAQVWVARYSSAGDAIDQGADVAVDGSGNVYVTGTRHTTATNNDFITLKYQTTGNQLWASFYNGPIDSVDEAFDVALDGSGNVIVTGLSFGTTGNADFETVKYNSSGAQQWERRYNGPANGSDQAYAVAVDGSNSVVIVGASQGVGTGYDYATIKYNSAGTQQWLVRYTGSGNASDVPSALKLDVSGNVYVAGGSQLPGVGYDFVTIKYSPTGVHQWTASYNNPESDDDVASDLAIDAKGNAYVTGYSFMFKSGYDYATVKYNSAGVQQWATRYDDPAQLNDEPQGIAVDALANVYVGGYSETEDGSVYSLIKYEAPRLSLSTNSMSFGAMSVGCRVTDSVVVRNLAQGNILVVTASSNSPAFTVSPISFKVGPSDSVKVAVTFAPVNAGGVSGKIYLSHNGISTPDSLSLSGSGTGIGGAVLIQVSLGESWRLYSLPVDVTCPYIVPFSYGFQGQYFRSDTLRNGRGYWSKFTNPIMNFTGYPIAVDTMSVTTGWNLIGSLSFPFAVASVSSSPDSIIRTSFFGYTGSYSAVDSLKPAFGFWVKVSQNGFLIFNEAVATQRMVPSLVDANSFVIEDGASHSQTLFYSDSDNSQALAAYYELPPAPPDGAFDVRFASNRLLETAGSGATELPVILRGASYPITLRWENQRQPVDASIVVGDRVVSLSYAGSVVVERPERIGLRIEKKNTVPVEFSLNQNYPNPFNPSTTIRFGVPKNGKVTLKVYDILGRAVKTLIQESRPMGSFSIEWNGTNTEGLHVASGLYICRLELVVTEGGEIMSESRKMLLLR